MAANDCVFSIQQKAPHLRPCTVNGEKALFHRWADYAAVLEPSPMRGGHPGGQMRQTYAIVEMEDGQVKEVLPSKVVFSDTREHVVTEVSNLDDVIKAGGFRNETD